MTDPKDPKSKKPKPAPPLSKRRSRKSSAERPRVVVVDATRGNLCNAISTITDTLIEVLSAMATGLAEVKATLGDRPVDAVFDEIELHARQRANVAVQTLSGVPVAEAVLAAGAALHEVVEAYKAAYAEAAASVAPGVASLRGSGCGHTEAEHTEMAASIVSTVAATRDAAATAIPTTSAGRMRGRNAGH